MPLALALIALVFLAGCVSATPWEGLTIQQIAENTLAPCTTPRPAEGSDPSTLTGKVMCGYQGWFNAEGDGAERGWYHYNGKEGFKPGSCKIDFWPSVSELEPDELYPTPFRHADGSVAYAYSAFNSKSVVRHFKWMADYGIDGVFVQRFACFSWVPSDQFNFNKVLGNIREGANRYGRTFALMYDLSGLTPDHIEDIKADWKRLCDLGKLTEDASYQRHNGKPVIGLWGLGFNDNRKYTPADVLELVRFFKDDPVYGGNTVMLGVACYWRTLERDCLNDPLVHEAILAADIVSPWTIGRWGTPEQATAYHRDVAAADLAWCQERGKEYMPVVFPGFSWHNMFPNSPQNAIPRLQGKFLWGQYLGAAKAGQTMIYQAMFDEVDEGTAIFKCTNDPPVGESTFCDYEGLPEDFYLRLVGAGRKLIRGEIPQTQELPDLGY